VKRPLLIPTWLLGILLAYAAVLFTQYSPVSHYLGRVTEFRLNTAGVAVFLGIIGLPLLLVRRRPLLAVGTMVAGTIAVALVLMPDYGLDIRTFQYLAADVLVGVVAATRSFRVTAVAVGTVFLTQLVMIVAVPIGSLAVAVALAALAVSTATMVGIAIRQRQERVATQHARAATDAIVAERLRIAREVHDMVAHSIAVIAIQAGMGRRVMRTQPEEASKALDTIEVTSRETLAGLRRTLTALRQGSAPLDPLPTLADLEKLADAIEHAGVTVEIVRAGVPRDLPEEIGLSAYRIIQEAVSNVARHAAAARCRVTVDYREGEVALEVVDEGRGCADLTAGYGLIGMRERAELLGGTFTAGPRPEGGFRVAATLPALTAAA
jgi:signal transduction histidine kinase